MTQDEIIFAVELFTKMANGQSISEEEVNQLPDADDLFEQVIPFLPNYVAEWLRREGYIDGESGEVINFKEYKDACTFRPMDINSGESIDQLRRAISVRIRQIEENQRFFGDLLTPFLKDEGKLPISCFKILIDLSLELAVSYSKSLELYRAINAEATFDDF